MACYDPIRASQERPGAPVRLWPPIGEDSLALPCGKCIGCRTDRATQWATRCMHEASRWKWNSFVTLTYDDNHLPQEKYLDAPALQRFFKRLRQHAARSGKNLRRNQRHGIRYFACGEYGEETGRPHYHALLFNCTFADAYVVGKDRYGSHTLSDLWPFGMAEFGSVTGAAANYVAQYSLKKIGAGDADADGVWRPAPFLRMSLRPAIGKEWLQQYAGDLAKGYVTSQGRKQSIPRTYQNWLKEHHTNIYEQLEDKKAQHLRDNLSAYAERNNPARQYAAKIIHLRAKQESERNRW